ncbi:MAG: DUF2867 domain-containing protein [Candidatus Rokubacteria bacterium]|nr:DUF2867 domain-containing protein [Candidatus Rokubacteria bacterium]
MRVDPARHRRQPWRVHTLAPDFELLDVWTFPIVADPAKGETFETFFDLVWSNGLESGSRITRFFVGLRAAMGKLFRWELDASEHVTSVAERLATEDRRTETLRTSITPVRLVYRFENEALLEIHNRTVSALLHFSLVEVGDGRKTPELAVYVRTRGLKSRLYMALIEPFRLVAVYPQWIAHVARLWGSRR